MSEIKIKVKGPHADEVVGQFWAWFLDGGGEQDFTSCPFDGPLEDNNLAIRLAHDSKNGEWFLEVVDNE